MNLELEGKFLDFLQKLLMKEHLIKRLESFKAVNLAFGLKVLRQFNFWEHKLVTASA